MNQQIKNHTFLDTAFRYVQVMLLQWLSTSLPHIYSLTGLLPHPPVHNLTVKLSLKAEL